MATEVQDPVLQSLIGGTSLLSVGLCLTLAAMRTQRRLLNFFPRRQVPWNAVGAFGPAGWSVDLGCPSTPEAVYWAIRAAQSAVSSANGGAAVAAPELAGV